MLNFVNMQFHTLSTRVPRRGGSTRALAKVPAPRRRFAPAQCAQHGVLRASHRARGRCLRERRPPTNMAASTRRSDAAAPLTSLISVGTRRHLMAALEALDEGAVDWADGSGLRRTRRKKERLYQGAAASTLESAHEKATPPR